MYPYLKRLLDVTLSGLGLLLLAPLCAFVALVVAADLGRPILYCQVRPGLREKPFRLYKFRTMREALDASGRPLPDSERLSRVGRFLRRSSLDELPQLWNVLRGDMSLVGPRPLFMSYLPCYTERERKRHLVRPGITGLAQVSGRNLLLWDDRLELDVRYVEKMSLLLDLRILVKTAVKILLRRDIIEAPGTVQGPLTAYRTPGLPGTTTERTA